MPLLYSFVQCCACTIQKSKVQTPLIIGNKAAIVSNVYFTLSVIKTMQGPMSFFFLSLSQTTNKLSRTI